jgi:hypothetical protein
MVLVGFIFALALAAVSAIPQHLWLSESWRQPTGDRRMEMTASEPLASATPAIRTEAIPHLVVQSSRGISGEPAPLGLALQGRAEGAIVIITGLVPGMELSTGRAVGDKAWQLSATDLRYASIAPSEGFVGSADLIAELRLSNGKMPIGERYTSNGWHRSHRRRHGPNLIGNRSHNSNLSGKMFSRNV